MPQYEDVFEHKAPQYEQIYACVHCGFCLASCPTYRVLGSETDSPRGRIYFMKMIADKRLELKTDVVNHLYKCVLCRGCEKACPSDIKYGILMEHARAQIERRYSWPVRERIMKEAILGTLPSVRRLEWTLRFLRFSRRTGLQVLLSSISQTIRNLTYMVPELPKKSFHSSAPEVIPSKGEKKYRVGLLAGCIMGSLLSHIDEATVRVLTVNGCEVVVPKKQACCGAAAIHEGRLEEAKRLAIQTLNAFEKAKVDAIITNSAGCGAFMKEYSRLFEQDLEYADKARSFSQKVRDINEFLASMDINKKLGKIQVKATYQEPCHLANVQSIKRQPRDLITSVPDLELIEMADSDLCCGAGATYLFSQHDLSIRLLNMKMQSIKDTKAQVVLTANPPCYMQLQRGISSLNSKIKVYHIVELLDESYRRSGAYEDVERTPS